MFGTIQALGVHINGDGSVLWINILIRGVYNHRWRNGEGAQALSPIFEDWGGGG